MTNLNDIEEVFTIESGNGLIDLTVLTVIKNESKEVVVKIDKTLGDTSFLIFAEGLTPERRIGLVKIGPDQYYTLQKAKSIIHRLPASRYLFPGDTSVDVNPSTSCDQQMEYLLITLRTDSVVLRDQFEQILNFFATVVEEVPGNEPPEVEAIKIKCGLSGLSPNTLYPRLPHEPMQIDPSLLTTHGTTISDAEYRVPSPSGPAKSIARGLVTGAEYVALGFNYGTQFAENLVHQGGAHLVQRERNYCKKKVDPRVISTLRAVRVGAETASTVAGKVVDSVATCARNLTQMVVPHIQRHGTRIVSNVTGKDSETSGRYVCDALTITASGMQGFATIYQSVKTNATQMAKAVAGETVNYVHKRYGDEAAEATNEALYAAGNTVEAASVVSDLAPKAMMKKVAKEAGKEAVNSAASSSH
jgi:putative lipoic acid-binding regulatory protein